MSTIKKPVFLQGDLVFAKVRGYPHWPARVSSLADDKGQRFHVFFYGTYETAVVKKEDLCYFTPETRDKYWKQTRKGFLEGLYEIENTPDIAMQVDDAPPFPEREEIETGDSFLDSKDAEVAVEAASPKKAKRGTKRKFEAPSISTIDTKVPAETATSPKKSTPLIKVLKELASKDTVVTPAKPAARGSLKNCETGPTTTTPSELPTKKRRKSKQPVASELETKAELETKVEIASKASAKSPPAKVESKPAVTPVKQIKPSQVKIESPVDAEKTSRSGRVIKQKKFDDEQVTLTPTKFCDKKSFENTYDVINDYPRKAWIQVSSTGDVVEVDLDQDRPTNFASTEAEIKWESNRKLQFENLRKNIEAGEFVPEEIWLKNEMKQNLEDGNTVKDKQIKIRQEKVRWLKLEQRLIEVDLALRQATNYRNPDIEKSVELLSELHSLTVGALVVKKHPQVVDTVRKLRKYVGPKTTDPLQVANLKEKTEKIRLRANSIYVKIKSSFAMPDDSDIVESLSADRINFSKALQQLEQEQQTAKKQRRTTK